MRKLFLFFLAIVLVYPVYSQNMTKRKVVTEPFTAINAGGISNITLIKGTDHVVIVEAPERFQDRIKIDVVDNKLIISYKDLRKLKRNEKIKFYITAPLINNINMSGASEISTIDNISGDNLYLKASGASDIDMKVDVKKLIANVTGAASVTLSGRAGYQDVKASGAADYSTEDLLSDTAVVEAGGAASVFVNVSKSLKYKSYGAATVKFKGNPENITINDKSVNSQKVEITTSQGTSGSTVVYSSDNYDYPGDTVKLKLGSFDLEVVDDDTVTVRVGSRQLVVDDNGNVKLESVKKPRFNGHWGGVEMGINGYLTGDFNTQWGKKYDYLNLRYEKSWFLNLNLWEQNIAFNRKKTIGMMTGVGMSWNNYRFSNSTYLVSDSSEIQGYYMVSKAYYDPDSVFSNQDMVRKSKLTNMYINVPVLFEYQSNNCNRNKRFHVTAGIVFGFRVKTHTKVYFNLPNEEYKLKDPETDAYLPYSYRTQNFSKRNIVKEGASFHQPPVRFDARLSFGYSWLNIFATYGINGMFQEGRGPKLHPWTIGLTLVGW